MKKNILKLVVIVALMITGNSGFAQTISKKFFGENAWMPDSIGSASYNGALHKNWGNIAASGAGIIRFGGTSVDKNMPTNHQYLRMVDSIRAKGMEPMMQVPFNNYQYSASQAAAIVKFLNVTMGRNVKYWVIGNEPDLAFGFSNSSQVAAYIKSFASAMKAADPSILIVGPETAWYNTGVIYGLTTPGGPDDITGKDANGRYYIDVISFHTYPFNGSQQRGDVIGKLSSTGGFEDNLTDLSNRVKNCNNVNGRTGANALKMAVTEANIDYSNPSGDNLYGNGVNSFLGGQFWAEMMGIAMKKGVEFINFWSVIEGGGGATNIGYLDGSNGRKKPAYYHFQMMAQNFSGTSVNATDNHANVKVFASKSDKSISVIILNEDQASNLTFTLKLNTASVTGNSTLKINVDANINKEYTDNISNQSTIVLVFDLNGNLTKKVEYKLAGDADANKAPTVTNFGVSTTSDNTPSTPQDKTFRVKVYPNPSNGKFTVEVNNPSDKVKMEMYNLAGQLVYRKDLQVENNMVKERVELDQNMASGMYIVKVKAGEQELNSKMLYAK